MECSDISVNGLTFDCCFSGEKRGTPVLLLHGFPMSKEYWNPLVEYWKAQGTAVRAMVCDLRGYSPEASPSSKEDYDYDTMATDVWALADAAFGTTSRFHLIGHDHGGILGWVVAMQPQAEARLLSYASLAVPHVAAFNSGLIGPDADELQQVASQYFRQFSLPDSATRNGAALPYIFQAAGLPGAPPEVWQKKLWWYWGCQSAGYLALPPVFADDVIAKYPPMPMVLGTRMAIPLPVDEGRPATKGDKSVAVPTLFLCGDQDPYIFCSRPFALRTKEYVNAEYTYATAACQHNLFGDCTTNEMQQYVFSTITEHVTKHTPGAAGYKYSY